MTVVSCTSCCFRLIYWTTRNRILHTALDSRWAPTIVHNYWPTIVQRTIASVLQDRCDRYAFAGQKRKPVLEIDLLDLLRSVSCCVPALRATFPMCRAVFLDRALISPHSTMANPITVRPHFQRGPQAVAILCCSSLPT
jgi:hypothetical protein